MSRHGAPSVQSDEPPDAANSPEAPSADPTPRTVLFGCPNASAISSASSARFQIASWWIMPWKLLAGLPLLSAEPAVAFQKSVGAE